MTESTFSKVAAPEAIVLLSGGLDSAVCSHLLGHAGWSVRGLFLAYGQAGAEPERWAARDVAAHLGFGLFELAVTGRAGFMAGELIGRNAFFVFTALLTAHVARGAIVLGIHAGTRYYDCSPAFVEATNRLVAEHTDGQMRLLAPLLAWSKADVLAYCRKVGIPPALTYSCEAGTVPVCGQCAACRTMIVLGC